MVKLKRIQIKEEYCIGCRLCEVYCITKHSGLKEIIKIYREKVLKPESPIYFEEKGSISFAIQCRHCDEAPCIEACITGAMYRDKDTDRVLHNKEKCVGCWMCVMTCPLGVIKIDTVEKKIASKCDLCTGRKYPVCVENCPNEAIYVIDSEGQKVVIKE
ncbi:MAG: 4Fe-4S dicluster domain-containing protein [Candidatus Omnitrophica bacterium]|nr:4Fe-4S dicluster domain-containing protein [Candidatus Omnitrophota bacterium]MCM8789073.1 4Fe-4S dicluster domain-containing protein [Candidatus Omnitrophota bacterium]